jgi:hypothetical protein
MTHKIEHFTDKFVKHIVVDQYRKETEMYSYSGKFYKVLSHTIGVWNIKLKNK